MARTVFGDDGSVTIEFSHTRPDGLGTANWIPAPEGPFLLATRFYAPTPHVLSLEPEPLKYLAFGSLVPAT